MRKILWICSILLILSPTQLFADGGACALASLGAPKPEPAVEAGPALYVDLGAHPSPGARLTFRASADGEPLLTQAVEILPAAGELSGPAVVELLASEPRRLHQLRELARERAVDIAVEVDGEALGIRNLADLEAQSVELKRRGASPLDHRSTVSRPTAAYPRSGACNLACDAVRDDCYDFYGCGRFITGLCYSVCHLDWLDCVDGCGPSCQPGTTTSSETVFDGLVSTDELACGDGLGMVAYRGFYRRMNKRLKVTTTTTTVAADCTETVSSTVTYYFTPCFQLEAADPTCSPEGPVQHIC